MLLRHTPKEIKERKALTVNPAKTCQPIGAMYAALGIHGCLPHSHGSQGCCSYHRSTLTRHYKEPVMAGTSSFTEGSSVFGGQANLLASIQNIFTIYEPEIIAVHSTCLSETIGDDLKQIIEKAREDGKIPLGRHVIHCNTPSYVGSHITGYANMVKGAIDYFAESTGKKADRVNLISGWVEPSDMREIKRIASLMGANSILLPDTSDVVDSPQTGSFNMYPKGGTTIADMVASGDSKATLACGEWATKDAAIKLENKCKVPFEITDIPIGIQATDRFVTKLSKQAEVTIPESINNERGRLLDVITDMHQYLHGKRVALWGDPDQIIPMVEFLLDLDMKPVYIVSGTPGKRMANRLEELLSEKVPEAKYKNGELADMFLLHQWIKNEPVDLLIGNTYGKYISRDEQIPFLRMGFPIVDRIGHSYFPTVGYMGGLRIVEKILGLLMDKQDAECPETSFELVM
ncbi:MAG: nitrogenase molybdenum-iron protein subunit beta [Bacteroidetes bacterium]|jgi:nitrogenase molybdenum-iron protein beta chain|nr:nitrogenase molybdenum-iron protein subunit beta [Bacteroidota bacterium]